jgi:D-aspartate ligase
MVTSVPPRAVVVGLDNVTGLQSARILARRGVPVIGVAGDPRNFACATNVCERIVMADLGTDALIDALRGIGSNLDRKAVLLPCTDITVMALSRHREALGGAFELVLPDHDVVELLMDKARLAGYLFERGFPLPRTETLRTRADAERAAAVLRFPAVVKPSLKDPGWEAAGLKKARRVADSAELLAFFDQASQWAAVLTAQEWVVGPERNLFSCNCYFDRDAQPQVTFVARKIRQWPPEIGISALGEECQNDEVLDTTLRLFGGLRYRGLGYLEMKQDERTGEHVVIEPNVGRPTGRSAIAELGGVELLYSYYRDALGLPLPETREQRYGRAKWIYWRHDAQAAFRQWRLHELSLGGWLRSWRGVRHDAVFALRDQRPFWRDLRNTARAQWRRTG